MFNCSCCNPPKSFQHSKSVWRHERKHNPDYLTPRERAILEYEKSPRECHRCDKTITYEQVTADNSIKYCSRSCAASANNNRLGTSTIRLRARRECPECHVSFQPTGHRTTYCSRACHNNFRKRNKIQQFEDGVVNDRKTLKRILVGRQGHCCEVCHNTEWMGEPIPLELDHIDGNAGNNYPNNLRLICPNCHAQTPTAKGKNRGRGRKSLGISRS